MASRPGFPHRNGSMPLSASSVSSTHVNNILKNYSNEQVVCALMTQLREKETQLAALSEQRLIGLRRQQLAEESNRQLRSRVESHDKSVAEKDARIAQLEKMLARHGNDSVSAATAEAKVKQLTDLNAESKRAIQERDDQLSRLMPTLIDLKAKVKKYENKGNADARVVAQLEMELDSVKGELAVATDENLALRNSIEELEKKLKGKEWVVKSLQDESTDQRFKENHLCKQIEKLNQKIETYEKTFEGKGKNVPMLVAKLNDYEDRVKDLQGQVRRLTNKKLNELVLRSALLPKQQHADIAKDPTTTASLTYSRSMTPQQDEEDNDSKATEVSLSLVNSDITFASTLVSNGSDDEMEQFYTKSVQNEDVLGDLLKELESGVESLQMEDLCCPQQEPQEDLVSPLGGFSQRSLSTSCHAFHDRDHERRLGKRDALR